MKRAMCIWLPDWPLQRLAVARPEPKRRTPAEEEAAGGLARVQGSGFRVQDFSSEPQGPIDNREALEELAACCGRFSPIVGLEDSTAPEGLLLDITGLAELFGGEAALAEKIVSDFARRGLTVRVAIADTIGAAWAVARYVRGKGEGGRGRGVWSSAWTQGPQSAICNLQFAICNFSPRRLPPSAFVIVPPGKTSAALHSLPIEALRLPEKTIELLHQLGTRRIGQLEALARGELSSRFGPQLLRRWDQATGRLAEPVPAYEPPPEFQADWSPEHPTTRRETVEAALEQLVGRVAAMLAGCGRGAVRLECRLECGSGGPVAVSVGLFEPTASAEHLFDLVRLQFERLRIPAPMVAMHVRASVTTPLQPRQQEMFPDSSPRRHPRHLAGLVDRLSSRLGRRSVVRARLLSDAQPERAWHYDPLVEGAGSAGRSSPPKPPGDLPPRPLRLLGRPIALMATSIMPDDFGNGSCLLQFRLRGREHQIAESWGPERIETGWWRGRAVGRDYYRVETTTGQRFWIFRRLRDGRWFMHGMFE